MLICHKRVASNEAAVLQACHMSDRLRRACNIGNVSYASVVRGCVLLSASSSLIYLFWILKHQSSDESPPPALVTQLSYPWKLHACRANNNYFPHIFFCFLLYVFGIVFNCIIQNNSYCLHQQYFFIYLSMANASNNSSLTGGVFYPSPRQNRAKKITR